MDNETVNDHKTQQQKQLTALSQQLMGCVQSNDCVSARPILEQMDNYLHGQVISKMLILACQLNQTVIARLLLDHPMCDPSAEYNRCIFEASNHNNIELVEILYDRLNMEDVLDSLEWYSGSLIINGIPQSQSTIDHPIAIVHQRRLLRQTLEEALKENFSEKNTETKPRKI